MNKKSDSSAFLDEDERELMEAIEHDDYEPGSSQMTPQLVQNLQEAARRTIAGPSIKVSIRIPRTDLARVKARALSEGIPYQTLIKSIIHQAVRS